MQKGQWRLNAPNQNMFLTRVIQIEKRNFFFKKGTFNEAYDAWMLYLSKIGPACSYKYSRNTGITN